MNGTIVIILDHSGSMAKLTENGRFVWDKAPRPTRRWDMVAKAAKETVEHIR